MGWGDICQNLYVGIKGSVAKLVWHLPVCCSLAAQHLV